MTESVSSLLPEDEGVVLLRATSSVAEPRAIGCVPKFLDSGVADGSSALRVGTVKVDRSDELMQKAMVSLTRGG